MILPVKYGGKRQSPLWASVEGPWEIHVVPMISIDAHEESVFCWCCPTVKYGGKVLVIHERRPC